MTQTTKYGFNLLQGTDPISPKPFNDNMDLVEKAFNAAEEELIKQVGTGGMNARIVFGDYTGKGSSESSFTFTTVFKPVFLAVSEVTDSYEEFWNDFELPVVALFPAKSVRFNAGYNYAELEWKDDAVVWKPRSSTEHCPFFEPGRKYTWVAIGYDKNSETE